MLEQKLKRLAEVSAVQEGQWDEIREEWIAEVRRLFDKVESWLHKWVDKEYLTVRRSSITLSEEHFGDYQIAKLELIAGPERMQKVLAGGKCGKTVTADRECHSTKRPSSGL